MGQRGSFGGRSHALAALASVLVVATLLVPAASAATPSQAPAGRATEGGARPEMTSSEADKSRGAPVNPDPLALVQPDGATFTGHPKGDGLRHWFETDSGHAILRTDDGTWVYATGVDRAGQLVPGTARPDRDAPPARAGLRPTADQPRVDAAGRPLPAPSRAQAPIVPHQGTEPGLVILASFSSYGTCIAPCPSGTSPASYWNGQFFGGSSSVRDFYADASFGGLDLTPATESSGTANDGVVGWVNLGYAHPNIQGGGDSRPIVQDAIEAANTFVNFASFDDDSDGVIETNELHVTVIMAGFESSYDGGASCGSAVWGHQWNLFGPTIANVDGKQVGSSGFTTFGERHCYSPNGVAHDDHTATMGIMAHEIGHDIGWPDLYDTNGGSEGVGEWSVMGGGSWTSTVAGWPGDSPVMPDPLMKSIQGWITPSQISSDASGLAIPQAETNAVTRRLLANPNGVDWGFGNGSGTGQYFLIENRQKTGYDVGLPGCGLIIWHVDETLTSGNSANADESHKLIDVEEADGLAHLDAQTNRGDTGDPFPGSTNKTSFGNATNPNSKLYNGTSSGVTVDIVSASCSSSMTINVDVPDVAGVPDPPTAVSAVRGNTQATVSWTAPANNGGSAITGYTATSNPGNKTCTTASTSCAVTGLTNGTSYTFTVVATNINGNSSPSSPSSAVTPATVPGAPTSASGVAGDKSATIAWSAPASNGGASITSYTATSSPEGKTCTTSTLTCKVTGLSNAVDYTFTVKGTNAVGAGAASSPTGVVVPTACVAATGGPFTDVSHTHPFCLDIDWLSTTGITGGYPDGTFRPTNGVVRQSMAAFLYRMAGEPVFSPPAVATFPDVPTDHPFYKEIEWLVDAEITGGYDDGTFRPGNSVSRQTVAVFLYRLAGEPSFTPPAVATFSDVRTSHPFYKEIEWLVSEEIASGYDDGTFRPNDKVKRQSVAAFLHHYDDAGF